MNKEENILEFDNQEILDNGAEEMSDVASDSLADDASDEVSAGVATDDAEGEPGNEEDGHRTVRGMLGNRTLEDVIEREAHEEQGNSSQFSLPRTLGGVIIWRFLQRQLWLCVYVFFFLIIYITLRYNCQSRMVAIDRLEKKIEQARFKATVCNSKLTEQSRESNVLKKLSECGDSTLTIPNEPPYLIRIEEDE